MKITLITQSDVFFLPKNLEILINNLPKGIKITSCILFNVSPFGKKKNFLNKSIDTLKIFGFRFFLFYALKYVKNKYLLNHTVESVLKKNNIKIIRLKNSINNNKSITLIKSQNPDLLISIAGNQIFKKELISLASLGCINLHTSLLPKYRGLMPTFWVLKNNENKTGVSVFFVDEGIDSGPIIVQKEIEINDLSHYELIKISKEIGINAIIESIVKIRDDNYDLIKNNDDKMTYFSFPKKDDVHVFKKNNKRFY